MQQLYAASIALLGILTLSGCESTKLAENEPEFGSSDDLLENGDYSGEISFSGISSPSDVDVEEPFNVSGSNIDQPKAVINCQRKAKVAETIKIIKVDFSGGRLCDLNQDRSGREACVHLHAGSLYYMLNRGRSGKTVVHIAGRIVVDVPGDTLRPVIYLEQTLKNATEQFKFYLYTPMGALEDEGWLRNKWNICNTLRTSRRAPEVLIDYEKTAVFSFTGHPG